MEEIVIWSETEGVNAEEKNSEVERAIFGKKFNSNSAVSLNKSDSILFVPLSFISVVDKTKTKNRI